MLLASRGSQGESESRSLKSLRPKIVTYVLGTLCLPMSPEGSGDPGRNRTDNIQLRRLALYPVELRGLGSMIARACVGKDASADQILAVLTKNSIGRLAERTSWILFRCRDFVGQFSAAAMLRRKAELFRASSPPRRHGGRPHFLSRRTERGGQLKRYGETERPGRNAEAGGDDCR